MAGQHIEREARYETTGMSQVERDALILDLAGRGWTQQKIADRVKMTKPGVHYALRRLRHLPRVQLKYDVCDGHFGDVPKGTLNDVGLCPECAAQRAR